MHTKNIHTAGKSLKEAEKALIMVHGRGGNAQDMLSLASHLQVKDFALLAPQATNNTWYPYSFLAPTEQNEPGLSSGLQILKDLLDEVQYQGIAAENIYFLGFSQGACLMLEFVARHASKFGGIVAFTGGLIGKELAPENYSGDFKGTPIYIGTGNPDPHVPLERVKSSAAILVKMNAEVELQVFENKPHSISEEEIQQVNKIIFA